METAVEFGLLSTTLSWDTRDGIRNLGRQRDENQKGILLKRTFYNELLLPAEKEVSTASSITGTMCSSGGMRRYWRRDKKNKQRNKLNEMSDDHVP